MFSVIFGFSSLSLLFIFDSAKKAAEDKILEKIVREARERAKKAISNKEMKEDN
ncbi:hypothetical protein KAH81_10380 [bacterium]|nr:hypothetical protein [bacterium]